MNRRVWSRKTMKPLSFSFKDSLVSERLISKTAEELKAEIENTAKAVSKGYDDDRASINLPDDKEALKEVRRIIEEKLQFKPECLIVIGIGGSSLGSIAVQEAVLGKFYNQMNPSVIFLCADTVDSDLINFIFKTGEKILGEGGEIILNAVSKSGATTETAANLQLILNLLTKYRKDYAKYVVVTSDKNSDMWNIARKEGFTFLEIPEKVGGRYSVFSPVSLFPLGVLGMDIEQLLGGARLMRDSCLKTNVEENPAVMSACIQYLHYKAGKNISDMFLFSNDLESLGKWYRQLMAESVGKEFDKKGKRVNIGMTPTVSIGSTDLHSMAQLYLGGPHDKFTTFVIVKENKLHFDVPRLKDYSELASGIQGKSLDEIMEAILEGTKTAYRKSKRPFIEIALPDKSEHSIGQFLQFKMMEIVFLAYLLGVNPFDQPNVESYKTETRKILSVKD